MASPRGFRADRGKLAYSQVEKLATSIRQIVDPLLQPNQPLAGLDTFEGLAGRSVKFAKAKLPLDYAVKALPPGIEGETRYEAGKLVVTLSEETYESLERDQGRAKYTLCHEIGHAFLHASQIVRMSVIPQATFAMQMSRRRAHEFCEDTEWQADACAACLLMPASGLRMLEGKSKRLTATRIQQHYGTSTESARIRLTVFRDRREEL